ncbi:hypothetical protein FS749_004445, partial [Ceratobasidium sp. UAMH 11750]
MPRKKAGGTLKRSSSDGPELEDAGSGSKRPRTDAPSTATSHITLGAAAHKTRKQVTYTSKARQGKLNGASPKLTSFGFNVENKPKHGHALFHISPSPLAKSKNKLFASPKAKKKKRKSIVGASADNSNVDISVDGGEQLGEEESRVPSPGPNNLLTPSTPPRPSGVNTASSQHDEHDDQPAPLPFLSPVRPIEGPGLEIRTPFQGRTVPASIQSLSKRIARTDVSSVPLFAATPHPPSQIPDFRSD